MPKRLGAAPLVPLRLAGGAAVALASASAAGAASLAADAGVAAAAAELAVTFVPAPAAPLLGPLVGVAVTTAHAWTLYGSSAAGAPGLQWRAAVPARLTPPFPWA